MPSAFAPLFGKESLVGLDIGSAYLKAVQVETQRGTPALRIARVAQIPTPPDAVRDGIIVDKNAVAGAIRQMLREAGIAATGAVTAVAGPTVVVRHIRLPRMTEAALRKSVRYEAAKHISANVEDSVIEFEILAPGAEAGVVPPVGGGAATPAGSGAAAGEEDGGSSADAPSGTDQMNVMLVAAPREMVESRIATVELAGLEAVAVDIEAFALLRALVECDVPAARYQSAALSVVEDAPVAASPEGAAPGPAQPPLRALVDLGASHTEVTILRGRNFALTRSIPIAGEAFTSVFRNHFKCSAAEAEQQKSLVDMALLLDPALANDPAACALPRLLQPQLDELLREVRRSIHYYQSQMDGGPAASTPLSEIVLSGGGAQLQGLAPYMRARLGTEVRVGDAFESALFDTHPEAAAFLQAHHPHLGVGLGLAVKELLSSTLAANARLLKAA